MRYSAARYPVFFILLALALVALAACTENEQGNTTEAGAKPRTSGAHTLPEGTTLVALESSLLDHRAAVGGKGSPVPDFSYTLTDGSTHHLSDLQGQRVMINFWATWCPPCNAEMPDIQEAFQELRDEGFVVLAVSQDADVRRIEPFVRQNSLTFPVIADPQGKIGRSYGVRGLPSSYFINSDGTLHSRTLGVVSVPIIKQQLADMQ